MTDGLGTVDKRCEPLSIQGLKSLIKYMRHPSKEGLLTLAGDEDCDIPDLTAKFVFGAAQIEQREVLDGN